MSTTPELTSLDTGAPRPADFNDFLALIMVLGEANRRLRLLTTEIETGYLNIVDAKRDEYATLQTQIGDTEAAIEVITRRNPRWFEKSKTLGTPYGDVKYTSSTELVVADEGISIQLIKALSRDENGDSNAASYLRTKEVLNKEALEKLSDAELARFAIIRRLKENFSVNTEVIDLGKAVKTSEKNKKTAAKAAKAAKAAVGES